MSEHKKQKSNETHQLINHRLDELEKQMKDGFNQVTKCMEGIQARQDKTNGNIAENREELNKQKVINNELENQVERAKKKSESSISTWRIITFSAGIIGTLIGFIINSIL